MGSSKLGLLDDLFIAMVAILAMIGAFALIAPSPHGIESGAKASSLFIGLTGLFFRRLARFDAARAPRPQRTPYDLSSREAKIWQWLEPGDSLLSTLRNGLLTGGAVILVSGGTALLQGRFQWERLCIAGLFVGTLVTALGAFRVIQTRRRQRA
jgi:hypothetical protein